MKKCTSLIIALSFLLTACSRQDAKFSKEIVGTWTDGKHGVIIYAPDGSFSITKGSSTNVWWYTGHWQIQNSILSDTITNASAIGWVGDIMRFHIHRLDAHQFEVEDARPLVKYTR